MYKDCSDSSDNEAQESSEEEIKEIHLAKSKRRQVDPNPEEDGFLDGYGEEVASQGLDDSVSSSNDAGNSSEAMQEDDVESESNDRLADSDVSMHSEDESD